MNQEQREKIDRIKQHADRKIWVTFRKEGIHKYPAAATDPALATGDEYDVSFLGTNLPNNGTAFRRIAIASNTPSHNTNGIFQFFYTTKS